MSLSAHRIVGHTGETSDRGQGWRRKEVRCHAVARGAPHEIGGVPNDWTKAKSIFGIVVAQATGVQIPLPPRRLLALTRNRGRAVALRAFSE
jgi:hypothetical protein